MHPEMIFFDIDGTLFDSLPRFFTVIGKVFDENECARPSYEAFLHTFEGRPIPFYRAHGLTIPEEQIWEQYNRHEISLEEPVAIFDSVPFLMRELEARAISKGIISANTRENIEKPLKKIGVLSGFDPIITETFEKAPALRTLCDSHHLSKDRTLYVGDMPDDMRDAKSAGVVAVGVVGRFKTREETLRNAGADHLIKDCGELLPLIDEMK